MTRTTSATSRSSSVQLRREPNPLDVLIAERRNWPRRVVSKVVKLEVDDGKPPFPALLVTDMSAGGMRLFAQDTVLPDEFVVVLADTNERRKVRVVWRIGPEAGLQFIDDGSDAGGRRRGAAHKARRRGRAAAGQS